MTSPALAMAHRIRWMILHWKRRLNPLGSFNRWRINFPWKNHNRISCPSIRDWPAEQWPRSKPRRHQWLNQHRNPKWNSIPTTRPVNKCRSLLIQSIVSPSLAVAFLQTIAKHKNGTTIGVIYTLTRLDLPDGTFRYSIWLSRDNTDPHLIEMQKILDQSQSLLPIDDLSSSFLDHLSTDHSTFDSKYVITRQRGRGGYGQVYLGHEKNDEARKVVIKFIKKTKVKLHRYVEGFDPKDKILFEVAILKQLKHPNIVQVSIGESAQSMIVPLCVFSLECLFRFWMPLIPRITFKW